MFDRVPVDVIEATLEVVFVADRVLPEAMLPDGALAVADPVRGRCPFGPAGGQKDRVNASLIRAHLSE